MSIPLLLGVRLISLPNGRQLQGGKLLGPESTFTAGKQTTPHLTRYRGSLLNMNCGTVGEFVV